MGRTAMDDENSLLSKDGEEEDQEEALSLSDLIQPDSNDKLDDEAKPMIQLPEDDFDFGSSTTEPAEMCAADDVFFRGRILPLRHSVSSDSGLALLRAEGNRGILSRSGSVDQYQISHKSTVDNSRSSSMRSQYSSSCSSSRSSSTKTINARPKPPNPFQHYSYRGPVPGNSNRTHVVNVGQGQTVKSHSNMWSIFRLGLVRTPTMEPLDIKFHSNKNNRSISGGSSGQTKEKEKNKKKEEQKLGSYLGGCKCSVETVVVPCRIASEKGTKEKTKRDMSRRHRTYEWLKELPVADDDEDADGRR